MTLLELLERMQGDIEILLKHLDYKNDGDIKEFLALIKGEIESLDDNDE